jgi:hypothetical protein
MSDMSPAIVPKSDQINADDLISGPITIVITDVKVAGGKEQPVSVYFEGSDKVFRPCKSMCRVMVAAWGPDTSKYTGRSLTLYCDPKVKWAGMEVGGIRISHMSDIDTSLTMALTITRANKKPYTVKPIVRATKAAAQQIPEPAMAGTDSPPVSQSVDAAAPVITPEEALALEARCTDNGIAIAKLKKAAKVERLSMIAPESLPRAHQWIDAVLAKRKEAA